MKCKVPVVILTAAALVFDVFYTGIRFMSDFNDFTFQMHINSGNMSDYLTLDSLVKIITHSVTGVLNVTAIVLFLIYILAGFKKMKMTAIVPAVFILEIAAVMISDIFSLGFPVVADFFNAYVGSYTGYSAGALIGMLIVMFIVVAIEIIPLIIATVSALKGLRKKAAICVLVAFKFLIVFSSILSFVSYIIQAGMISGLYVMFNWIYAILLYTAILLFVLTNRIPAIIKTDSKRRRELKMKPEKALDYLLEIYSFGEITEEEYAARRMEVLARI